MRRGNQLKIPHGIVTLGVKFHRAQIRFLEGGDSNVKDVGMPLKETSGWVWLSFT